MFLFLVLAVCFSCTDDDILIEAIDQSEDISVQERNPNEEEPIESIDPNPVNNDSSNPNPIDTDPNDSDLTDNGCNTNGGLASDTGFKSWCWEDITIPDYSASKGTSFSQGELHIDSECYEKQVSKEGNRLKFKVNPTYPAVENWCSRDFNMRAEIRTKPWNIRHSKGTEEWFGWSYTFGDNYVIDKNSQWLFFQVHPGMFGVSPHTELMIAKDGQFNGHDAGEIYVVNSANGKEYHPTGITPKAGETIKIVVHAIWGDASNGLLQVWINGEKLYDRQVATVYDSYPWGGNAKWGIYKWPWANENSVQKSLQQGVEQLETYMGPLRMITRRPGDSDYGNDSYSLVAPH